MLSGGACTAQQLWHRRAHPTRRPISGPKVPVPQHRVARVYTACFIYIYMYRERGKERERQGIVVLALDRYLVGCLEPSLDGRRT